MEQITDINDVSYFLRKSLKNLETTSRKNNLTEEQIFNRVKKSLLQTELIISTYLCYHEIKTINKNIPKLESQILSEGYE